MTKEYNADRSMKDSVGRVIVEGRKLVKSAAILCCLQKKRSVVHRCGSVLCTRVSRDFGCGAGAGRCTAYTGRSRRVVE